MERYNNIIEFDEISSTNDYSMDLVRREQVPEFTVVRTDFQTKGRGQVGNCWVSNRGENLLFSVILHPSHIPANNQFILSQCVSMAVRDTIACFCDNVMVKWPNDVYVGERKIAGILIENLLISKMIETSIVGIGLNVNQTSFVGAPNPTSLKLEIGQECDSKAVLELFLTKFKECYEAISENEDAIRTAYKQHLYLLNTISLFKDKNGVFKGEISDVGEDGKLLIIDEKGTHRLYYFKEVDYLHPHFDR